jgi:hypothetical protein
VDLFQWILIPARHWKGKLGLFPADASFSTHVPETVLEFLVLPFLRGARWTLKWFKFLQWGHLQVYILYILLTLVTLILWR